MSANLGKISVTVAGDHILSNRYERLTIVKDTNGVWYISLWDVPPNIPLSDTGYWKPFFEPQLSNRQIQEMIDAATPSGVIVMWSGSIDDIPTGWALCDGNNGTPDLRDRFVVGAGASYAKGATGGSKDAVVVSHSHTIDHHHASAYTSVNGNHNHYHDGEAAKYTRAGANGGACYAWYFSNCSQGGTTKVGDGYTRYSGSHRHVVDIPSYHGRSGSAGTSGKNKNLPPYFALAYIMKL